MYCKKCGCEVSDKKIKKCPQCGARVNGLPAWAVVLIVLAVVFAGIPILLFPIGIIAAMTIPVLVQNTEMARNKTIFKKSLSTFNQAIVLSNTLNEGKSYTKFDEVWTNAKNQFANPVAIPNGVRLADGTEVFYKMLNTNCSQSPDDATNIGEATACAILTIDANGFDKGPNKRSTDTHNVYDQFEVYLYQNVVAVKPGTVEYDMVYQYDKN